MTAKGGTQGGRYTWTSADCAAVVALAETGDMTQREIAARTGIPLAVVSRMIRGIWVPPEARPQLGLIGRSPLTAVLRPYLDAGTHADELTVQTRQNDPFRQDTETLHKAGRWLRDTAAEMGVQWGTGTIHLRGLHYLCIGQPKPDGTLYANTDADDTWLGYAGKAARWLGYVAFDDITDHRNTEPVIRIAPVAPDGEIRGEMYGEEIGNAEFYAPYAEMPGYQGRQPYRLAIVGEKSSLEPVLGPLAGQYGADLYLPTGELSDTQIYRMASAAAADGRPLACFYFADCDPSGWQMGISLSRKLQGFRVLLAEDGTGLEFRVYRVALTPDQVRGLELPSTPLKDTERRADRWTAATGTEQTEVDALMALRPGELDRLAGEALAAFYDATLAGRTARAVEDWKQLAQQVIDDGLDGDRDALLAEADGKLDDARGSLRDALALLETSAEDDDLPEFEPPDPVPPPGRMPDGHGTLLVSSAWDFAEQCRALRESKAYGAGAGE